jgi:hypothetical protein
MRHAIVLALVGFVAVATACSGRANLYERCPVSGRVDDCVGGTICALSDADGAFICQIICGDKKDCPAGTDCKGVDGANVKSCRPQK